MNYTVKIAYIGGGSRAWARKLMADLAIQSDFSGEVRLYDIDENAARDNALVGKKFNTHANTKSKWNYIAVDSHKEALEGADFVVLSILPGTFKEMQSDVHLPEEYGILQSVGDTSGPGGIVRAMRTIPMYEQIAESIRLYCPDAFVINFTNPMTLCTRTLYSVFPQIKAFGCCHEVFGTQEFLGEVVKQHFNVKEVKRHEIDVDVFGVNHFTWFTRAEYKGTDLFPIYKSFAEKELSIPARPSDDIMVSGERIKLDLFLRYGQIAAAGDRHLAEFVNNHWYLNDLDTVAEWGFSLTPVSWRIDDMHKKLLQTKRILAGEEQVCVEASGEEFVILMRALLGIGDCVSNVNLPNQNRVTWAEDDAIIETNAQFTKGEIKPLGGKPVNRNVVALLKNITTQQENVFAAIRERNIENLFQIFLSDPLCSGLTLKKGRELFNRLVNNTAHYLNDWKISK